ncbi:MAG: transposase family protein, partial [Candidatus Pacebacteria bacterium]|nr:transposase family protein [Candidatus Paceibacterota bacterium]
MITDERSRKTFVSLHKTKDEIPAAVILLCRQAEVETGKVPREFHSDNGTEFVNKELKAFFEKQGTRFTTTTPGTPQHNGIAERVNREIFNIVRAILFHADMAPQFWGHAVQTAVHVKNKLLTKVNGNLTPDTIWNQQCHALNTRFRPSEMSEEKQFKSSVKNLRTFGCNVYYHLQNQKATEPRSAKGIFLGYSDEGKGYYRLLDLQSRKVVIRRDVHFDESSFTFVREYTRDRYRPFDLESSVDESRGVKEAPISSSASMPHVGGATSSTSSHSKPEIRSNAPVAASSPNTEPDSRSDSESDERENQRAVSSEAAARPAMPPSRRVRLMLDDRPVFESDYTKAKKQKPIFDAVRPENIISSSRRRGSARSEALMLAAAALKELADHESTVETEQKTDPPQESSIEEEFDDPEPQYTPKNWKQAMKCRNAAQWYKAAQHEISQMEKTGTYRLVQRPPGANVIGSSWTWAKKYGRSGKISRFRARLVARGDKQ